MGIFDFHKPHVSKRAFDRDIYFNLRKKGFSQREINKVKQIFRGDLEETGRQIGIDRDELGKGVNWMRRNIASHGIPSKKIDIIEKELRGKIK